MPAGADEAGADETGADETGADETGADETLLAVLTRKAASCPRRYSVRANRRSDASF